ANTRLGFLYCDTRRDLTLFMKTFGDNLRLYCRASTEESLTCSMAARLFIQRDEGAGLTERQGLEDIDEDSQLQPSSAYPDRRSFRSEVRSWMRDVFFAAMTAILIVIFVVQPVKVEGTSMQPELSDQERIFVNKFVYHFSEIERGDVVVFWYPRDPT